MPDLGYRYSDAATHNAAAGEEMPNFINPQMNVSETENEIRITVELPGVTGQDRYQP